MKKEYKIDISITAVRKQATLLNNNNKEFTCEHIIHCNYCDCEDCIFNYDSFTLEELKQRIIK